jgi:glycosyltransferase involved in cell wall biosynthesis
MSFEVSACVICQNEAARISRCLDSLAWCGDIVVVDSGSTDGTAEIAAAHPSKPRVISHRWSGYNRQREFAVSHCANDWVLALDADEECSPELALEIQTLVPAHNAGMFRIPRKNFLAQREVRCWSPDYQTRLLHRRRTLWDTDGVPEVRRPAAGFEVMTLKQALLHNRFRPYAESDLNDGATMVERASLLAGHLQHQGRHGGWCNLLFRPILTFLKYFILRGGFLQGRFGLVIAYKTTIGVMLKYSVLYGREELASGDSQPQAPTASAPPAEAKNC